MQIVQIRLEAQSFNGPFDVRLDMLRLVCHRATSETIESALGSQEDFVSNIVFPDEIAK